MKGTIVKCLQEMVEGQHGKATWKAVLAEAGLGKSAFFSLGSDVDDRDALALFHAAAQELGVPFEEAAHAFGRHWSTVYAPRVYQTIYSRLRSAREFILAMEDVHTMVTETIANAHPPRFEFDEEPGGTVLVTYKSSRGLIDLYIGLAYGVGEYFGTPLEIQKLGARQVRIRFP